MLAQDTHTGALYEVPEHLGAYGEHYDGLGFPGLGNLFKSVVGAIPGVGNIVRSLPGVGNILGGILGGGGGAAPVPQIPGLSNIMSMIGGGGGGAPAIPGLQNIMGMLGGMLGGGGGGGLGGVPAAGLGFPGLLPFQLPGLLQRLMAGGGLPFPPRPPMPFQFPFQRRPPGWIPSPVPFTGMRPRRAYMRCSVWPGPPALIPAFAAQAQVPGGPLPPGAVPGVPGALGPGGGRHRRGRRRRR